MHALNERDPTSFTPTHLILDPLVYLQIPGAARSAVLFMVRQKLHPVKKVT